MNQDIKFTIIIPTRDRADVLKYALASATAQDYENLEIIVSDNASIDNTYEVVSQAQTNDPRIKYINTGERLSMSHNWEFALNHVTDGWVTILGDDDAILIGALQKVSKIIHETNIQAVRSAACYYAWPSLLQKNCGYLSVEMKNGYKKVNSKKALSKVMNGTLSYSHLPMLYNNGFIDFSLIQQAKKVSNNFYLSMTPDVYSAIVFSLLTDEYIYSFEPFAINGASSHSGGTATFSKNKTNKIYNPAEKILSEKNIPFHQDLPLNNDGKPVKSLQAIVYESYLQALPFVKKVNLDINATHQKQLEIILRTSLLSPFKEEVLEWGRKFADLHSLNFEEILSKSCRFIYIFRIKNMIFSFIQESSKYTVYGNDTFPIRNVFEASIGVGLIRKLKPTNLLNLITRVWKKFF